MKLPSGGWPVKELSRGGGYVTVLAARVVVRRHHSDCHAYEHVGERLSLRPFVAYAWRGTTLAPSLKPSCKGVPVMRCLVLSAALVVLACGTEVERSSVAPTRESNWKWSEQVGVTPSPEPTVELTTFKSGKKLMITPEPTPRPVKLMWKPTPTPTLKVESTGDRGFSNVLVWRFCSAAIAGNLESGLVGAVVGLDEHNLTKEHAKRVYRLVVAMYEAWPKTSVELMRDTVNECQSWRRTDAAR